MPTRALVAVMSTLLCAQAAAACPYDQQIRAVVAKIVASHSSEPTPDQAFAMKAMLYKNIEFAASQMNPVQLRRSWIPSDRGYYRPGPLNESEYADGKRRVQQFLRDLPNLSAEVMQTCFPELYERVTKLNQLIEAKAQADEQARRAEAERRAEEARRKAIETEKREAEARKPINALGNSYVEYIFLKRCREDREGYLVIHISDAELTRARHAVERIEQKMKPQLDPGVDTNWMWEKSNEYAKARRMSREACQMAYTSLVQRYNELVPEDARVKKDF
jgi:hypothetical protein